jgi:hypothetical protein
MIMDVIILNMFEELLSLWQPHRGLVGPPTSRIQLWSEGGRGVWISESWGPAVPYGPIDHEDGNQNHGYMRVKGDAIGTRRIPEAMGWPELVQFLDSLNADASPIESVGCEKSFFPVTGQGDITVSLSAYIDVIFSDPALNERPENILLLASHLLPAVEGCEKWCGNVSMVLQPMRFIAGATAPWGLMLHITNHGRSEAEARKFWGVTIERLGKATGALPKNLKWHENRR